MKTTWLYLCTFILHQIVEKAVQNCIEVFSIYNHFKVTDFSSLLVKGKGLLICCLGSYLHVGGFLSRATTFSRGVISPFCEATLIRANGLEFLWLSTLGFKARLDTLACYALSTHDEIAQSSDCTTLTGHTGASALLTCPNENKLTVSVVSKRLELGTPCNPESHTIWHTCGH